MIPWTVVTLRAEFIRKLHSTVLSSVCLNSGKIGIRIVDSSRTYPGLQLLHRWRYGNGFADRLRGTCNVMWNPNYDGDDCLIHPTQRNVLLLKK